MIDIAVQVWVVLLVFDWFYNFVYSTLENIGVHYLCFSNTSLKEL